MADFFNKVVKGINKGVNSVGENSKIFIEKNRLTLSVKETNNKKKELIYQLGQTAYNLQKSGEIKLDAFMDLCSQIRIADKKIEVLKKQLDDLQELVKADETNANNTQMQNGIRCTCGYINKTGSKFCMGCGNKIVERLPKDDGDNDFTNTDNKEE